MSVTLKVAKVRVRLLVGQASAARMSPSSLQGCIHGGLSGKQPYPEDYFHLPGRCPAFMSVTLKVMVDETPKHLEKAKAFSLQNHARECDSFSYRTECNSSRLAGFAPVEHSE